MNVNRNDVYMFLFENMSASVDMVAEEFDITLDEANNVLSKMADDSDAILESGTKGNWRVRNWDELDDDSAMSVAWDAFGPPSVSEPTPKLDATLATPTPVLDVPRASQTVLEPRNLERARENFGELAQSAPTESGRRFWQAKLDTLPAS